jgi:hypothetical protein
MPADHSLRRDDHERFLPLGPHLSHHHPKQAIEVTESRLWVFSFEGYKLLAESKIFQQKGCVVSGRDERSNRAEDGTNRASQIFIADYPKPVLWELLKSQQIAILARHSHLICSWLKQIKLPAHLVALKASGVK